MRVAFSTVQIASEDSYLRVMRTGINISGSLIVSTSNPHLRENDSTLCSEAMSDNASSLVSDHILLVHDGWSVRLGPGPLSRTHQHHQFPTSKQSFFLASGGSNLYFSSWFGEDWL